MSGQNYSSHFLHKVLKRLQIHKFDSYQLINDQVKIDWLIDGTKFTKVIIMMKMQYSSDSNG